MLIGEGILHFYTRQRLTNKFYEIKGFVSSVTYNIILIGLSVVDLVAVVASIGGTPNAAASAAGVARLLLVAGG